MALEDEDRDQVGGDVFISQGTPKIANKTPEARNTLSLIALRKNKPWRHFDLRLPISKTGRQYISVVDSSWDFLTADPEN